MNPGLRLTTVNMNAADVGALARFYRDLLGWQITTEEPDWVILRNPAGGVALSFETDREYRRPVWPSRPSEQLMMMHLDIQVDDLEAAGAHAEACGATLAEYQPQQGVRVYLDPAGHPFCLWVG